MRTHTLTTIMQAETKKEKTAGIDMVRTQRRATCQYLISLNVRDKLYEEQFHSLNH